MLPELAESQMMAQMLDMELKTLTFSLLGIGLCRFNLSLIYPISPFYNGNVCCHYILEVCNLFFKIGNHS